MERVLKHPVLPIPDTPEITFYFEGMEMKAKRGEMISSALFANGIRTFGLHPKDGSPQGIFCANGQCAQCLVIADGLPVKSCMESVQEGMKVHKLVNLPELPDVDGENLKSEKIEEIDTDLLVIGAGPSGLGAAIEAAKSGLDVLVVDDKSDPGGKLLLQTHAFFGSVDKCYAGTRGLDIAYILSEEAAGLSNIKIKTDTMAVGVYSDSKVGILENGVYKIVKPKTLLVASGAREKALTFPGCDLPGVYGAGAFQTLLNRDLVKPSEKLFIVGGGNVGIIAGYHAIQAGIPVVGLVEGLPQVGGYWVHADKLKRLGVPIYTSTTVVSANGKDSVESVTVAEVDKDWKIISGTYRTYPCDTLLIAVGLSSINEIHAMAQRFGIDSYVAGDAEEIAEASAAMFSGRVTGRRIARVHGKNVEVPPEWEKMTKILKSKPGHEDFPIEIVKDKQVFPVIRCVETIPCNPCSEVCPQGIITIPGEGEILPQPEFSGECTACGKCVATCPGLAISLVDYRTETPGVARVILPFEIPVNFKIGDTVRAVEHRGDDVAKAKVVDIVDKGSIASCRSACPADVRAQGYIELIRKGNYERAYEVLQRDMPLPSVCGRVCYHPCEDECERKDIDEPVAICALKRFISDWSIDHDYKITPPRKRYNERVAVVGSGPAGLACANELAYRGYSVTVFESRDKAGGMLRYGIPAYRLPDKILDQELEILKTKGIEIKTGVDIDRLSSLMADGFKSVFVGIGAQNSSKLEIPGEELKGVIGALDFLRDANSGTLKKIDGTVAIMGGGNSAIDAARTAIRLDADEVKIIYRRSREEMPAHDWEIEDAIQEGAKLEFLTAPVEVMGDKKVKALRCIKMELGEPDDSGRRRPVPIESSDFEIAVDYVISAVGQVSELGKLANELEVTSWGSIKADELTYSTNLDGVFAGGDIVTGAATVVKAFAAGKDAAESIDRYLRGVDPREGREKKSNVVERNLKGFDKLDRVSERSVDNEDRKSNFKEVVLTMSEDEAKRESERCLGCGHYSDCMPGSSIISKRSIVSCGAKSEDKGVLVVVEVEKELATKVAGIRIQDESVSRPVATVVPGDTDDVVVCRCERITLGQIRDLIRAGVRDMNQLKGILKAGMGACGGKTCGPLIESIFRREGVSKGDVACFTERPLVAEVPMGKFAGIK